MKIELCAHVYSYFKRFWWQLSSYAAQRNPPELTVTVNVHADDPYFFMADRMVDVFSPILELNVRVWDTDDFQYRYNTRTKDIQECNADWLLFTDSDLIFHPDFFSSLIKQLKPKEWREKLVTVGREDLPRELVDTVTYETPITDIMGKITGDDAQGRRSTVGAGYFQLVDVGYMREAGITEYALSGDSSVFRDAPRNTWKFRTAADRKFRHKFQGTVGLCPARKLFHIDHVRMQDDKEAFLNHGCF